MKNKANSKFEQSKTLQKVQYREVNREWIEDQLFLSKVISIISEYNFTEFVVLKPDFITFVSVKLYNDGRTEIGEWINRDNPYICIYRNEYGMLQAGPRSISQEGR